MKKFLFLGPLLGIVLVLTLLASHRSLKDNFPKGVKFLPKSKPADITLGFAGEIILARDVAAKINQHKDYKPRGSPRLERGDRLSSGEGVPAFKYPFYGVADLTKDFDLFFATLEAPLSGKNIPCGKDCMKFIADEEAVEGLVFSGIDVVSLAANHIMDGGQKALKDTLWVLDKNGIAHTGAGLTSQEAKKPVIKEINGVKLGFITYNEISPKENTATSENLTKEVNNLKMRVDLVIVAFHWGTEYTASPSSAQKKLAHQTIEAGADLVIGDHPHWIQGIEFYQGKPIFYSVGNFVFDQMWSIETRQGIIGLLTYKGKKLVKIKLMPFQIDDYAQPRLLGEKEKTKILDRIFSVSDLESVTIIKSLE